MSNMSGKPKWEDHEYPAICLTDTGAWFGLHEAKKPFYNEEWKGKVVTIANGQGTFLKFCDCMSEITDIEECYEVRP